MAKKLYVDQDTCIGCTLCTQICPKVYKMNDEGKSEVTNQKGDKEDKIEQSIKSCPVDCIKWKE